METSYTTYFDESGDEGFIFKRDPWKDGSSEWFALAAVIHHTKFVGPTIDHYAQYTSRHKKPDNWHFHFRKAPHDERVGFIQHMAELPWTAMSVAIHKPSLTQTENFKRPYFLYFYTAKLLLERISWFLNKESGRTRLYLSSRKGLRQENLEAYLALLKEAERSNRSNNTHSINWSRIDLEQTQIRPNSEFRGLQTADAVASGIWKAIERSKFDTTEHRYVKLIKPILYKQRGSYLSYGIKFFPAMTDSMKQESRFHWLKEFE